MLEAVKEWQTPLLVILLTFILVNIWFERYRRSKRCEYTLVDKGNKVKIIYRPAYHALRSDTTVVLKDKVIQVLTTDDTISFCYASGHSIDLVCGAEWLQTLYDEACFLFPQAEFNPIGFTKENSEPQSNSAILFDL
ncbi:hypothetical protein J1N51_07755 [Psychrosphaera ytuae]|uniref:Uncharacterized protein n=1 Tax=Psychrosphaera ytuae TaxID=2820710 RepID=A0A975D8X6_9GAMM|nr:hypothetical protein [Psychrosphaera ytuae]QTH62677.1 hypothetical protein J1N51_07755 [Psychrosphaera ytuae]